MNELHTNAARTYEHLILKSWNFFDSKVCCDLSSNHGNIAAQQVIIGISFLSSNSRNRLVNSLERDGGANLNNEVPYSYPKTRTTPVPPDVLDYLDEVTRCAVYELP